MTYFVVITEMGVVDAKVVPAGSTREEAERKLERFTAQLVIEHGVRNVTVTGDDIRSIVIIDGWSGRRNRSLTLRVGVAQ